MTKKMMIFFLILLLLTMFSSCHYGAYYFVDSLEKGAFLVAGYNIPGVGNGYDIQVKLLEEDSYGRKMYQFSCLCYDAEFYQDGYSNEVKPSINLRAYVISQKETKKGVYYLDSICYIIRLSWSDFTDEVIEEFKVINQWEHELDTSKLSYRPYPNSNLGGIDVDPLFDEVEDAYEQHTGNVATNGNVYIQYVCNDSSGKCLAFVREYDETSEKYAYVIVVSPSDSGKENLEYYITELDDFYQQNDAVKALKEEAGWVSPKE